MIVRRRFARTCFPLLLGVLALTGSRAQERAPAPAKFTLPAGFSAMRVAAAPLTRYPMLVCLDERGRLFVAENAGVNLNDKELLAQLPSLIRVLDDTDGDGVFDRSSVFADHLTYPEGVLWHDGALYVASPPSIWKLEDTDGDGRADRRTEIATGFGFNGNAADVHGPSLHRDGRLYWPHARKPHEVFRPDGSLLSKGTGARIWTARLDGSDLRVHAGGGMDTARVADPRGEAIAWASLSAAQVCADLGDARPLVRNRAVTEATRRADVPALAEALASGREPLGRLNALWALTRVATPAAQAIARRGFGDSDARVRQVAASSAFSTNDAGAFDRLFVALRDSDLAVRREAARALGRLQNPAAVPALADATAHAEGDPFLLHALGYALIEIGDTSGIARLLQHPAASARRAALIALDQIPKSTPPPPPQSMPRALGDLLTFLHSLK